MNKADAGKADAASTKAAGPAVSAAPATAKPSPAGKTAATTATPPSATVAPAAKPATPAASATKPETKAEVKPPAASPVTSPVVPARATAPIITPPTPVVQTSSYSCGSPSPAAFAPPASLIVGKAQASAPTTPQVNPTPDAVPGWSRGFSDRPTNPKPKSPSDSAPVSGISAAATAGATEIKAEVGPANPAQPASVTAEVKAPVSAPAPASPAPTTSPAAAADAERAAAAHAPHPEAKAPAPAPAAPVAKPQPTTFQPVAAVAEPRPPVTPADIEQPQQPPMLFEVAWEVCWQLGGIYTVLRSKAQAMIDRWGDRYCLIGPYNPGTAAIEFEEQPAYGPIREVINKLRDLGVPCHFGRWLIPGRPRVILIDQRARYNQLHVDKYLMWEDHRISLPSDDGEVNDVTAFGFSVAEFFRVLTQVVKDRAILAHFHEWMGGVAVPRIAHLRLPVSTVFTTHATLLGRYLAGDNPFFYDHLPFLNPDQEAGKYNIYPRFAIERAAAHACTVFTTVSDVTAFEAEKLLGRTADVIVPNGINLHKFAAPHEFQHLHAQSKERIHDFVKGHFFPSYSFDLDRTLYVFTSGRYEYRNKGMDLFIEAMHRLNWRLKGIQDPPTVIGFVITRAPTRNINVRVLQNQSMYEDLRNTCQSIQREMGSRLLNCTAHGKLPAFGDLLKEDEQVRLKRAMHAWKTHQQPLIVTHDLADDANDPILNHLRHRHMFNAADDPVKMVFHPEFLSATNPVMSMDYDQFVRGCHMGIFPSYYEPWGYTPLECIALGVPTVTSDLSGFGSYVQKHVWAKERRDADRQGIHILQRRGKGFDEACDALVNHLFNFAQLNRRQRIEMRNRTERLSEQFDWSTLVNHYTEAHNMALQRIGAARQGHLDVRMV